MSEPVRPKAAADGGREDLERRIRGLKHMVGNTPVLVIDCTYRGARRTIYAKAENLNMTGSIKDRMALHILGMAPTSAGR